MGQMCCRPNRPPTTPTSSMTTITDPLTSSYNTPITTSYVQRPSTPVISSNITKCPECHQLTSTLYWNWCQHCSARHFSTNFMNWSSGNPNLDKLIQEIQLNATHSEQVIEWIPYDRFQNIKFISRGGFGEVMYAEWVDGQIYNWDTSMATWKRRGKHPVALKKLKGSEECPEDFLNEVRSLHSITHQNLSFEVTHCFGISQDPITNEYIMVISYAENGSLHHYLRQHPNIDWPTRICYLLKITQGLNIIHSAGLVHRDFHSGNILMGKRYPMVSDFGLSRYVGRSSNNGGSAGDAISPDGSSGSYSDEYNSSIFGVIPYISPEVLRGHPYTTASDIYSFGMIMYELLTDHQPFDDTAHDLELITKITSISAGNMSSLATPTSTLNSTTTLVSPPTSPPYKIGIPSSSPYAIASQAVTGSNSNNSTVSLLNLDRPSLHNIQHPKCWIRLMYKCWNDDPSQRPTIVELKEVLDKWYQLMETNVARNKEDLEILRDFRDAENFRMDSHKRSSMSGSSMKSGKLVNNSMGIMETRERHPEACYYSRKIPTTRLVRKLEEQMGTVEARDYINLKFMQKDPLIKNISKSDLRSSLATVSTINNLISSQHHRQSDTLNNVREVRDTDDDDMSNRDSIPNNSNLGKSVVGGVLEMLRDGYTVEEMNQMDGGGVGIVADTQKDDFLNLLNAGLESNYLPNIGGNTPSQNSNLGIPNNNNDPLIIEDENQISPTIDTTQKLSFNDSNIMVVSNATSNTSRTHAAMNYFRDYPRKNSSGRI